MILFVVRFVDEKMTDKKKCYRKLQRMKRLLKSKNICKERWEVLC